MMLVWELLSPPWTPRKFGHVWDKGPEEVASAGCPGFWEGVSLYEGASVHWCAGGVLHVKSCLFPIATQLDTKTATQTVSKQGPNPRPTPLHTKHAPPAATTAVGGPAYSREVAHASRVGVRQGALRLVGARMGWEGTLGRRLQQSTACQHPSAHVNRFAQALHCSIMQGLHTQVLFLINS